MQGDGIGEDLQKNANADGKDHEDRGIQSWQLKITPETLFMIQFHMVHFIVLEIYIFVHIIIVHNWVSQCLPWCLCPFLW